MSKTAIEVLNGVYSAGKKDPDLYETVQVNDRVFVAAIMDLAAQLERFNRSKQDKIVPAHLQVLANDLTRGALSGKLSRVLADAGINEKAVALTIYQFLESL
jgi:hypothetical protein